jgi:nucleolar protein TMA23
MDVYRHLQGLGWRGSGFSLDKSDRGLKKPLLISRKFDSRGVGSKTQAGRQADHWWLTAYDSALSTLGDKNRVRPTKALSNHC